MTHVEETHRTHDTEQKTSTEEAEKEKRWAGKIASVLGSTRSHLTTDAGPP